jgi:hypothetical protein
MAKTKKLSPELREKAVAFVKANEFQWWMDRRKVFYARLKVSEAIGKTISHDEFKEIRLKVREWFKVERRPRPSKHVLLSSKQWDRLEKAVVASASMLKNRSIEEVVAIVSLTYRCNATNLNGLTRKYRIWER